MTVHTYRLCNVEIREVNKANWQVIWPGYYKKFSSVRLIFAMEGHAYLLNASTKGPLPYCKSFFQPELFSPLVSIVFPFTLTDNFIDS